MDIRRYFSGHTDLNLDIKWEYSVTYSQVTMAVASNPINYLVAKVTTGHPDRFEPWYSQVRKKQANHICSLLNNAFHIFVKGR